MFACQLLEWIFVHHFANRHLQKLAAKKVELAITEEALDALARQGFDPKMGARPLARLIDRLIKKPLSSELLFGNLEKGGKAIVEMSEEKAGNRAEDRIKFRFSN